MASKDSLRKDNGGGTRAWSIHEASPLLGSSRKTPAFVSSERRVPVPQNQDESEVAEERRPQRDKEESSSKGNLVLYVIYALVNVIIAVPGLYGRSCRFWNVAEEYYLWGIDG
eukprot:scaffold34634_cov171-Amphora_coffeaeformis.AAC.12